MGSSISGIVAEIFLPHLENSHLNQILEAKNIIFYTRYVDILIIYDTERTSSETIHNYMNKMRPNLEFTPTQEHNNSISFLDLLIIRQPSKKKLIYTEKRQQLTQPLTSLLTTLQNTKLPPTAT
jgi:hypothetical protein